MLVILFTFLSLKTLAREQCTDYPLKPAKTYLYNELFENKEEQEDFKPSMLDQFSGEKERGFFQISPSAFIDYSTGELHDLKGSIILPGSQSSSKLFVTDENGKLKLYNPKSKKYYEIKSSRNKKITDCTKESTFIDRSELKFSRLCKTDKGDGVLILGGEKSRVVPLTAEQAKIVESSNLGNRSALDQNISVVGDDGKAIVLHNGKLRTIRSSVKSGKLIYVNPDNPKQVIKILNRDGRSQIIMETNGQRKLLTIVDVDPSGIDFKFSVYNGVDGIGINLSQKSKSLLISGNFDRGETKVTDLNKVFPESSTLVTDGRGVVPYMHGVAKDGKVRRLSLINGKPLSSKESLKRFSETYFKRTLKGNRNTYKVADDLVIEINEGKLNLFPKSKDSHRCIPNSKFDMRIGKSCQAAKRLCRSKSIVKSLRASRVKESQLARLFLSKSNPDNLNLDKDIELIVRGMNKVFVKKYPDITQNVLKAIYIKEPILYENMISEMPYLKKLDKTGECTESYRSCLVDNSANPKGAEKALEYASSSGSTLGLKLFASSISEIPKARREKHFKEISAKRALLKIKSEPSERFEIYSAAQGETKKYLGFSGEETKGFKAVWECPSSITPSPSFKKVVDVGYMSSTGQFDLSGMKDILVVINKFPKYDFTGCLANLHIKLIKQIRASKNPKVPNDKIEYLDKQLMGMTLRYANEASKSSAMSPLVARSSMTPPMSAARSDSMLNQLIKCDVPSSPYAIDKEFLSRLKKSFHIFQNIGEECRKNLERNYIKAVESTLMSEQQCLKVPKECRERTTQAALAMQELAYAGILMDNDYIYASRSICHNGRLPTNYLTDLFVLNRELTKESQCVPLAQNESKDVHIYRDVHGHYQLKRLADSNGNKHYQISITIRFLMPEGEQISPYADEMYDYMTGCFAKHKTQFRDDKGNTISFVLKHDKSKKNDLMIHKIRIHEEYKRADAGNYPRKVLCSTGIHETMHLLGLPDEYHDKSSGSVISPDGIVTKVKRGADILDFDCRIKSPANSLMFNHEIALAQGSEKSLLYPAQFRMLTQPHCDRANEKYLACTSVAYSNSSDNMEAHYGKFFGRKMCPVGLPDYCKSSTQGSHSNMSVGDWLK